MKKRWILALVLAMVMAGGKLASGDKLKMASKADTSGENLRLATDQSEVPSGTLVLARAEKEPENVPENVPIKNVIPEKPPENVPPEQPPEIPPGMEIRDGYWVSTAKPTLRSASDTPPASSENLHTVEMISAEQTPNENLRRAQG
jgi:hypothetical protein